MREHCKRRMGYPLSSWNTVSYSGVAASDILTFSREPEGACCEGRDSPQVQRDRGPLRVRCDLEDPLDEAGTASRNLQQLPPVLHGAPEADRHRRTRGAVH